MRLFNEVAVVTDVSLVEDATAIRHFLESLRLRVHFFRLVQTRHLQEFFREHAPRYDHTVLTTHGSGGALQLKLVHQQDERWDEAEGWEERDVVLDAAAIAELAPAGKGSLVSTACGGGHPDLAEAFLRCGYDAYVGNTTAYGNAASHMLFVCSLFHFLLAEDRDYDTRAFDLEAAVAEAARIDDWKYGTSGFTCYRREP